MSITNHNNNFEQNYKKSFKPHISTNLVRNESQDILEDFKSFL